MTIQKITDFLVERFTEDDLRRLVRYHYRALDAQLPARPASRLQVAEALVLRLENRGALDASFFNLLRREREHFIPDIDVIERGFAETEPPAQYCDLPSHAPSPGATSRPFAATDDGCTDVAILVALKEEWRVLWNIAGKPKGAKVPESGRYVYRFEVASDDGPAYHCVALCIGDMGPEQASNAATTLLRHRPRTIVNVGIAAALHDDLRLCDVVVAEQVDGYLATVKAVPLVEGIGGYEFEFRGSVYKTTHSLLQEVDHLEFAHPELFADWQATCAASMATWPEVVAARSTAEGARMVGAPPAILSVHLASGPVLAASEAFSRWVRQRDGLLKALEMEAAGMMLAAHHQPTPTLVLRGISDFGDSRKAATDRSSSGGFRNLAMTNATSLLWTLMRGGLLPRQARDPDGGVAREAEDSIRGIARQDMAFLQRIAGLAAAGDAFTVPKTFVRSSRQGATEEDRRLHALLRELRSRGLVQPEEGGKWSAGKRVAPTPLARIALQRRSTATSSSEHRSSNAHAEAAGAMLPPSEREGSRATNAGVRSSDLVADDAPPGRPGLVKSSTRNAADARGERSRRCIADLAAGPSIAVHYSCLNLHGDNGGPPMVTGLVARSIETGLCESFTLGLAGQKVGRDPATIVLDPTDLERQILCDWSSRAPPSGSAA